MLHRTMTVMLALSFGLALVGTAVAHHGGGGGGGGSKDTNTTVIEEEEDEEGEAGDNEEAEPDDSNFMIGTEPPLSAEEQAIRATLRQVFTAIADSMDAAIKALEAETKRVEDEIKASDHPSGYDFEKRLKGADTPEEKKKAANRAAKPLDRLYGGGATGTERAAAGSEFGGDDVEALKQWKRLDQYWNLIDQTEKVKQARDEMRKVADAYAPPGAEPM